MISSSRATVRIKWDIVHKGSHNVWCRQCAYYLWPSTICPFLEPLSLAMLVTFLTYESHTQLSVLEDGLSSNGGLRSAAPGGIANPEKKMNCGTQCPNSQSLSGSLTQKQNGLWATEAKRDTKRMSAKEVTINVTENLRQMDRSKRITKNCVN
ncbi:Baalc [Phodopus roborovskii]|uniref:Baalc protein n=1 Tax=Phodopus roborovskii TaxID=109678 RepID=A0AAV0A4K2_PHORO|nr:Baalc [Phodopus roborovskii]